MYAIATAALPAGFHSRSPRSTLDHHASVHTHATSRPHMSSRLMHSTSSSSSASESDDDEQSDLPQPGDEWPERTAAAAAGSAAAAAGSRAHGHSATASSSSPSTAQSTSVKHARHAAAAADDDGSSDEQEMYDVSPLPTRGTIAKPKGMAERKQQHVERAHTPFVARPQVQSSTSSASSAKNTSMGANLARKRANSLKWSKYNNLGAVTIELDMSNEDLRRV
ncbi:hypothetical protein ACM66B_006111 [Microbotryomycetes sp. NB124-2]